MLRKPTRTFISEMTTERVEVGEENAVETNFFLNMWDAANAGTETEGEKTQKLKTLGKIDRGGRITKVKKRYNVTAP